MRYLVKLKPLEPFMFGGEQTFGTLGDKEQGNYLVKSRPFPQQSAILGMLKKELMTQAGLLTRKRRGEWVDKSKTIEAINLVGGEKFNMLSNEIQDFGIIDKIGPIFLQKGEKSYIKKANIDEFPYEDGKLKGFTGKVDIYDNFIELNGGSSLKFENIFQSVEQTGNKKGGEENSLFKKTSFILKDGFEFAFYLDLDSNQILKKSMVTLGADRSMFKLSVEQSSEHLKHNDAKGYLTLLSDALINVNIKSNCDFAITSELSYRNLKSKKSILRKSIFEKSETVYLYEKGSVFINPSELLLADLNQENLQQIGYNIYTIGEI